MEWNGMDDDDALREFQAVLWSTSAPMELAGELVRRLPLRLVLIVSHELRGASGSPLAGEFN